MTYDFETLRTVALGVVSLGQTLFVILYATFPWYKTFLGRALFYKAVTLAVLTDVFIVSRLVEIPHADIVFVALYLFLGYGVWWQFLAFLKVRREGRQHPGLNPDHEPDDHQR